jgi:hypothetical protein
MSKPEKKQNAIIVSGDITIDWNLTIPGDGNEINQNKDNKRFCCQPGGAALLATMVQHMAEKLHQNGGTDYIMPPHNIPRDEVHPMNENYNHSFALWAEHKYDEDPKKEKKKVWRVHQLWGLDRMVEPITPNHLLIAPETDADIIILDDANLGFRDQPELWPGAVKSSHAKPWILLKMVQPIAKGLLWEELIKNHADRLIVVTSVNELRLTEVQISRGLSWERTAQDMLWELTNNPAIDSLSKCAHVIVSFDTAGAFLLSNAGTGDQNPNPKEFPKATLCFDPKVIEGMWLQNYKGNMVGYSSCLTTAIASQLMLPLEERNLQQGIMAGLAAMRELHREGYDFRKQAEGTSSCRLRFPYERIINTIASPKEQFSCVRVNDPAQYLSPTGPAVTPQSGYWTILEEQYSNSLNQISQKIVLEGIDASLHDVPLGQFGDLVTVDRREIENFRSIRSLIIEYCNQPPKKPLSIAVFGPPGSGKSFGIEEVAKSVKPGEINKITFNLSQFNQPVELLDALHQVRDVALSGSIPLVFWDEFDTSLNNQPLGWLRYFLAPMQDGNFQQGQITHPIGRSIFVFAGGTSERMEDFGKKNWEEFIRVKGPDFISRLKGFVNIMGPNPQDAKYIEGDPFYVIRRAILLRGMLQRLTPQLIKRRNGIETIDMDPGILRAFLFVSKYKHGARSMESLITMSMLSGKNQFERSALPSEAQLNLHVNSLEFLALVQLPRLEGKLLDEMAAKAHQIYCEGQKETPNSPLAQTPYQQLDEHYKEMNRANIRDIQLKLVKIGYTMIPARGNLPPFDFPIADIDRLAEMEHERWLRAKIASDWRYGSERNEQAKTNPTMVPWHKYSDEEWARLDPLLACAIENEELPEEQKEKDRVLVKGIPRILAAGSYTVVKLQSEV